MYSHISIIVYYMADKKKKKRKKKKHLQLKTFYTKNKQIIIKLYKK